MPEQDETPLPLAVQAVHEVPRLGRVQRLHYHGFLQTPLSCGHRFRTFHMFVDELCLQLISDCRTAVRREARAQQSDLLRLQGVGQHHPERSHAATGNNLCVVCCAKYNKWYLKKHQATAYGNMPHNLRKTTFWCSTGHKYLFLRVGSTSGVTFTLKFSFGVEPSPE